MRVMHRSSAALRAAMRHGVATILLAVGAATSSAVGQQPGLYTYGNAVIAGLSEDGSIACGWFYTHWGVRMMTIGPDRTINVRQSPSDPWGGAYAISPVDGTLLGWAYAPGSGNDYWAVLQAGTSTQRFLPLIPGLPDAVAVAASSDGRVVIGYGDDSGYNGRRRQAFVWTEEGGLIPLGFLRSNSARSYATGVSADGSTVIGVSNQNPPYSDEAFVWTATAGIQKLPDLTETPPFRTRAQWISQDGSVIVGSSQTLVDRRLASSVARWDEGVVADLGIPPGYQSAEGLAANADASIIVGNAYGGQPWARAFVWSHGSGFEFLETYLRDRGVDVPADWRIESVWGMSADGRTFIGELVTATVRLDFIATIGPCPADWDRSGGVDGDDIAAFFEDWQRGEGDIDRSGGTDADDITYFFTHWQRGC